MIRVVILQSNVVRIIYHQIRKQIIKRRRTWVVLVLNRPGSEHYVEALRAFMLGKKIEARPVWKPMHKQPVYKDAPAYINGVSEAIFKIGMCLPAGPWVTDEDVYYIVECIKEAIVK